MTTAALTEPRSLDRRLTGFGPVGIAVTLVIAAAGPLLEPVGAVLALVWAKASHTPLRALGFARPASWFRTIALGILSGAAFKLVMKALVMPLLGSQHQNAKVSWY